MNDSSSIWSSKSDAELLDAAQSLTDYSEEGANAIKAELRRRGLALSLPAEKLANGNGRRSLAWAGSAELCVFLGLLSLAIGIYFLLIKPGASDIDVAGNQVANIHRLVIGQTFSIVGGVFLAAGLRPR